MIDARSLIVGLSVCWKWAVGNLLAGNQSNCSHYEKAPAAASPTGSVAHTCMATTLVETERFVKSPFEEVHPTLKDYRHIILEGHDEQLSTCKKHHARRRQKTFMLEVENKVTKDEDLTLNGGDAATGDESGILDLGHAVVDSLEVIYDGGTAASN